MKKSPSLRGWFLIPLMTAAYIISTFISSSRKSYVNVNLNHCPTCTFKPSLTASSTEKDLIITAFTGKNKGLDYLVRSVRTSGCKAKIIVMTTENEDLPPFYTGCGVEQYIVANASQRTVSSLPKVRWEWYHDFLQKHGHEYDRIFHVDSFDVFVFGDPFTLAFNKSKLYFIQEGNTIGNCPFNSKWVRTCHPKMIVPNIGTMKILCSGTLIGGSKEFTNFVEMLVTHPEWANCWGKGYDQGDFNYLYYNLYPKENAEIIACQDGINTVCYCTSKSDYLNKEGYVVSKFGPGVSHVVHQYNRIKPLETYIHSLCPA